MIVIRRMVDRRRAYTAIFLKGEPPKIFPTSDAEHARILQVYKQDRPHEGILNDFAETDFPRPSSSSAPPPPHTAPSPWPLAKSPAKPSKQTPPATTPTSQPSPVSDPTLASKKSSPTKKTPRPPQSPAPLWLALAAPPQTSARL